MTRTSAGCAGCRRAAQRKGVEPPRVHRRVEMSAARAPAAAAAPARLHPGPESRRVTGASAGAGWGDAVSSSRVPDLGGKRAGGPQARGARAGVHIAHAASGPPVRSTSPCAWRRTSTTCAPRSFLSSQRRSGSEAIGSTSVSSSSRSKATTSISWSRHPTGAARPRDPGFSIRVARAQPDDGARPRVRRCYHARVLRTPTEVRHAIDYVLGNARKHAAERGETYAPLRRSVLVGRRAHLALPPAQTWLLRAAGCERGHETQAAGASYWSATQPVVGPVADNPRSTGPSCAVQPERDVRVKRRSAARSAGGRSTSTPRCRRSRGACDRAVVDKPICAALFIPGQRRSSPDRAHAAAEMPTHPPPTPRSSWGSGSMSQ